MRRFPPVSDLKDAISACIPPRQQKNFAVARLMEAGGVLEAISDAHGHHDVPVALPTTVKAGDCHVYGLATCWGRLTAETLRHCAIIALKRAGRPCDRSCKKRKNAQLGPRLKGDAAAALGLYGAALEQYLSDQPDLQECVGSKGVTGSSRNLPEVGSPLARRVARLAVAALAAGRLEACRRCLDVAGDDWSLLRLAARRNANAPGPPGSGRGGAAAPGGAGVALAEELPAQLPVPPKKLTDPMNVNDADKTHVGAEYGDETAQNAPDDGRLDRVRVRDA